MRCVRAEVESDRGVKKSCHMSTTDVTNANFHVDDDEEAELIVRTQGPIWEFGLVKSVVAAG